MLVDIIGNYVCLCEAVITTINSNMNIRVGRTLMVVFSLVILSVFGSAVKKLILSELIM